MLGIVHTEASQGWGGQELRTLAEAGGMIRRGHRVTLLCVPDSPLALAAPRHQVPVETLPIGAKHPAGLLALHRWLRDHPVEVVIAHSSTDHWLAALALRGRPTPLVRMRHISTPVRTNWTTRWLYQRATRHVVTAGEAIRQRLIEHNGHDPQHVTSIPTGIDLERFQPGDRQAARQRLGLPPEGPMVGIVATLRNWKGHLYLFHAFAQLADPTARLLVVGDGPQRRNLERLARDLELGDRLLMPGNQEDVVPWLNAMDLFVLPSYADEGVPQSLMQAMLCGLPVLTTPVGSIGEIVDHNRTGWLVAPKEIPALRDAMAQLLADAELRARLGQAAQTEGRQRFGVEVMLERMESLLAQVILS